VTNTQTMLRVTSEATGHIYADFHRVSQVMAPGSDDGIIFG